MHRPGADVTRSMTRKRGRLQRLQQPPDRRDVAQVPLEGGRSPLRAHGAELVGELEQYEDSYRLCYVRGPEGIIVALAEQLS